MLNPRLSSLPTPQRLGLLVLLMLCVVAAGCGFHLKGESPLPFTTLYTNISDDSAFGSGLRRAILASSPGTRFVEKPSEAQATLTQLENRQSMRDLSIDARGRVEEYELNLVFTFQLTDAQNHLLLPPTTLRATRELPYDPDAVQAKQGEIGATYREMQQSLISLIVRRLSAPEVAQAFAKADQQPLAEPETQAQDGNPDPAAPWVVPRVEPGIHAP